MATDLEVLIRYAWMVHEQRYQERRSIYTAVYNTSEKIVDEGLRLTEVQCEVVDTGGIDKALP